MTITRYALAAVLALPSVAFAQDEGTGDEDIGIITQADGDTGRMSIQMEKAAEFGLEDVVSRDALLYEPYQMTQDLFRKDLVFLMRHGPTDWSVRDVRNVAPDDCAAQRVLSPDGEIAMTDLGILMAANGVRPGRIVVSEWCRNQQTVERFVDGFARISPERAENMEVQTDPGVSLLLSMQGAPSAEPLEEIVSSWTGEEDDGPLLVISHYTNIEEMTNFRIFEGEMLVIDPALDNRVLGYMRLASAEPDVGHFPDNSDVDR